MNQFNLYSKYYDLLYSDKDYKKEVEYILNHIKRYIPNCNHILELGFGSGNHAIHFIDYGLKVSGIEKSLEMVELAKNKNLSNFFPFHGDITSFHIEQKFDTAISLFHVISYLTDNLQIEQCLLNVNNHLNAGGIFIFDIWYTPAVYSQKPEIRIKRLSDENLSIVRISEPNMIAEENIVEVNFDLFIEDKANSSIHKINELHKMRHFSVPELKLFAKNSGFEWVYAEEYLTGNPISEKTWGITVILKKI
jgi:hypothetical protein